MGAPNLEAGHGEHYAVMLRRSPENRVFIPFKDKWLNSVLHQCPNVHLLSPALSPTAPSRWWHQGPSLSPNLSVACAQTTHRSAHAFFQPGGCFGEEGGGRTVSLPVSPRVHREVSVGLVSQNVRVHVLHEMASQISSTPLSRSPLQIGSDSCLHTHHPSVANVSAS